MHFTELRAAHGQLALHCAVLGLFVSASSPIAQELPSAEPLDAKSLAKRTKALEATRDALEARIKRLEEALERLEGRK